MKQHACNYYKNLKSELIDLFFKDKDFLKFYRDIKKFIIHLAKWQQQLSHFIAKYWEVNCLQLKEK